MAFNSFPDSALLLSSSDPNDPNVSDSWTDITARGFRIPQAWRGRQYELDQTPAGRMSVDWRNVDEAMNPANASSTLLANIKLMRRFLWMAMYPRGGTGNLLNPNNPDPITRVTPDGSFESYLNGSAAPGWITPFNTVPTVTTTNPQQGTKSLTWTTVGTAAQFAGWWVSTIPGRQYTCSVQLRQTIANTAQVFVDGGAAGTTTTTTAAYVQLSVVFTATSNVTHLFVGHFTPTNGNVVNIDAVQVEPGGSVSAFTTAGPRIRGIWGGHTERLPATWEPNTSGYAGRVPGQFVGPTTALAQIDMFAEYKQMVLSKSPKYYWPLWDGSSATAFADIAGVGNPPLVRRDSKYGAATNFGSGVATNILGDPGGTGVATDSGASAGTPNSPASLIQTGAPGTTAPRINLGTNPTSSTTHTIWMAHTTLTGTGGQFMNVGNYNLSNYFTASYFTTPNRIVAQFWTGANVAQVSLNPDNWADGKMHFYAFAVVFGASTAQLKAYVDGTLVSTGSSVSTAGWVFNLPYAQVQIGAAIDNTGFTDTGPAGGTYAHAALWDRELTAQDVTDLWNAGRAFSGEVSGAREARYLGLYYNGRTIISPGRSVMGPGTVTDNSSLLANLQGVNDTEAGTIIEDRDGWIRIESRDDRFFRVASVATFGENTGAGEIPYEEPTFGYDTTQVNNQAVVTSGSAKVTAKDTTSTLSYYQRSIPVTINAKNPLEAQDRANYLVATRKQPQQRIQTVTLNPGATPSLWPVVLDLEIGQRYTVKRVAKAANSGAGITMTGDYFLEKITHRQVDPELGTWYVDLQLSPVQLQPWILEDPTYGLLGITTILGF